MLYFVFEIIISVLVFATCLYFMFPRLFRDVIPQIIQANKQPDPDDLPWHLTEDIPDQAIHDWKLGRNSFYVYVLKTDWGHYVGHTADLPARLDAHKSNKVASTAGRYPEHLWTSDSFPTRNDAADFEAQLKNWRDHSPEQFFRTTGYTPVPFGYPPPTNWRVVFRGLMIILVSVVVIMVVSSLMSS